jgi:hypothetical protein
MRKHTLILVALAATLSACALDDEALEDQALDTEAPEDEALEPDALDDEATGEAPAVDSSTGEPGAASATAAAPACNASAPGSGWVLDSAYGAPNACRKCQEAGRRLEASGRWRTHCTLLGGIGPALLFRFCVACLSTEAGTEADGL